MASPSHSLLAVPTLLVLSLSLSACPKSKKPEAEHAAHGHAVVLEEHNDGMLERVEDEDTHWVELPNFGECPYEEGDIPPFKKIDDKHVPKFDPKRARGTNMDAGEHTVHNETLLNILDHATVQVLECVSISACYDDRPLASGVIEFKFEVSPQGKVLGVNVEPTPKLDHKGVRQCARVAIFETEFPVYDGADMVVDYELDIE